MQVVVGAAIVRAGRLLVARRTAPPALAGRWELPGGKVEPGEAEPDALVRECREELGVLVRPLARVGPQLAITTAMVLRAWHAELVEGTPRPHEHDRLRWLAAAELEALDWLPADRPLLAYLSRLLEGR